MEVEEIEEIEARAAIIATARTVALPGTTLITIRIIAPLGITTIRTVALAGIRIIRAAVSRLISSTRREAQQLIVETGLYSQQVSRSAIFAEVSVTLVEHVQR